MLLSNAEAVQQEADKGHLYQTPASFSMVLLTCGDSVPLKNWAKQSTFSKTWRSTTSYLDPH